MSETVDVAGFEGGMPLQGRPRLSFDEFSGRWDVRRVIVDRMARATYRFEGIATIDVSSFAETGTVRWGETSLKGERSYGLRPVDGGLDILFPDGRLFVALGDCPAQSVYHLCGDDHYAGRFFFAVDGAWAEAWRVTGPRKRYASLARYRRPNA